MELVNEDEIKIVLKQFGYTTPLKWYFEEFQDKIIGYLGDHLKLTVEVENSGVKKDLRFFVKCMPRNDKWKAEYLEELNFFKKEYVMLSSLFIQFGDDEGIKKWRPKLLYIRKDLFIFEDVCHIGFLMPHHREPMTIDDLTATIQTMAKFHAASYILEEKKSKELGRPYRIWEDYSDYLQEPSKGQDWRDTGRNAAIDFLKQFSKYKSDPNVMRQAEMVIPMLFEGALHLMKPSIEYRNVVVHRDLWTNNIMIKKHQFSRHALFVDFQTVLYCSPMLDLTSVIYFNTTRTDRDKHTSDFINTYYDCISSTLHDVGIDMKQIFPKDKMIKSYKESIMFGITQAALIVPIVSMSKENREAIFCHPEKSVEANVVSRSKEFIEIAEEDETYCGRVSELLDEMVERYMIIKDDDHKEQCES